MLLMCRDPRQSWLQCQATDGGGSCSPVPGWGFMLNCLDCLGCKILQQVHHPLSASFTMILSRCCSGTRWM